MVSGFLDQRRGRDWSHGSVDGDVEFFQGNGTSSLEIVVLDHRERPTKERLQRIYTDRRGGRVNPILVVAIYGDKVGLCGPSGEEPPIYRDVDRATAERVCDAALNEPDRHTAQQFLSETLPQLDEELIGIRNQGLLSTHELRVGVPDRDDWDEAGELARRALTEDPRELLVGLNFDIERLTDQSFVLKDVNDEHERAVAVFLREDESFDHAQERFVGRSSPVAYALNEADKRNLEYVIGSSGDTLRLYTTNPNAGFGSRGRTDTYVEVNTGLLSQDKAAYLWLLFSANALRDGGSLEDIMERSKDYAAELGGRLRERIYDDVVPDLAEAIAAARDLSSPTKEELDETYRMALVLLYRLLFISYAEDEEFLPRRRNSLYDQESLKRKARELHEFVQVGGVFDAQFTNHWDDVMRLSRAIHHGHDEWGLPAYDGRILSEVPDVSYAGSMLAEIQLNNDQFGPVLVNLLIDETEEGYQGPVDFRNIGVREFGVIYEGLLESELSVANQPLGIDSEGQYVPVDPEETPGREIVVEKDQVYLHNQSGERKATGTYYTKNQFVEHLLSHSLEPAIDDHIERIDRLREEVGESAAADAFFDIRIADIAMGSGHFLVGAVDRIESRLYAYLTENSLTPVEEELDNLKEVALAAFEDEEYGPAVERGQLLRRQVARRCIYGVDLNPLATELARLSIWVHTFVPGLPLTFLDYNLITGDSLTGIGTIDEVAEILDVDQTSLDMFTGSNSVMNEIREKIDQLGRFADSSAEQIQEARKTRAEIEDNLEQVKARFDILAASRIDDGIDTSRVSDSTVNDVTELSVYEEAQNVLKTTTQLHFPVAFPEVFDGENTGFDVIIGNPPWEKPKVERDIFWKSRFPGLYATSQTQTEKRIDELEKTRPDLVAELNKRRDEEKLRSQFLTSGPYPGIGGSDPDLYAGFIWRFWQLLSEGGFVGVVLPRAALLGPKTEEFRQVLVNKCTVKDITLLTNKGEWVFDGTEQRFTIALLCYRKMPPEEDSIFPLRGPFSNPTEYNESNPHELSLEIVKRWTKSAFPMIPSESAAVEALQQIASHPPFNQEADNYDWRALLVRELDATEDKEMDDGTTIMHFINDPPEDYWPVYKGSSFNLWDPDTGERYAWADPDVVIDFLQEDRESSHQHWNSPFSEMSEKWIHNKETLPCLHPRVAFRQVARSTDSRTILSSLVPPETILTHHAWYFIWPKGSERDESYVLGIISSMIFDWYARRFVEANVTKTLMNSFPIPRKRGILRQRIVEISGRLAAIDERYADWAGAVEVEYGSMNEDEKREMIHELDATVAHLYGLSREHVEVIFETFHEGWDYQERLDNVLDYYDKLAELISDDAAPADD